MALQSKPKKPREIDPNEIKFQFDRIGDSAEGYYAGTETFTSDGDELTKHKLLQPGTGKVITFLGGAVLNGELVDVEEGVFVKVTYKGKPPGKRYKDYAIDWDLDNRQAV